MADKRRMYPKPLEFVSENVEFKFSELENEIDTTATHIVMIKKGGQIENVAFQEGQVLSLQTISRDERVVAKPLSGQYQDYYSIPTGIHQQFIVIGPSGREISQRDSLYELVKKHKLPFRVMFPRNEFLKHESKHLSTNYAPQLELLYTFTENHYLANFIVNENIQGDILFIPFHDSDIRVALVTGIKGMGVDVFERFQGDIDRACMAFEYDMFYGNIDVGVYSKDAPMRGLPITRTTAPLRFASFAELFDRPRMPLPAEQQLTYEVPTSSDDYYEDIDDGYEELKAFGNKSEFDKQVHDELTILLNNKGAIGDSHTFTEANQQKLAPKVFPKPSNFKSKLSANENLFNEKGKPSVGDYANDIPRGEVAPVQKAQSYQQSTSGQMRDQTNTFSEASSEINSATGLAKNRSEKLAEELDISKLTIDEVCDYLKTLKLNKYIDQFREDMVDGQILLELDQSILVTDFKFKSIEAIRLMKFIKDGHLPT